MRSRPAHEGQSPYARTGVAGNGSSAGPRAVGGACSGVLSFDARAGNCPIVLGRCTAVADPGAMAPMLAHARRDHLSRWCVDGLGITRSLWLNLSSGKLGYGGSTLTMQAARLFLSESAPRSIGAKLRESHQGASDVCGRARRTRGSPLTREPARRGMAALLAHVRSEELAVACSFSTRVQGTAPSCWVAARLSQIRERWPPCWPTPVEITSRDQTSWPRFAATTSTPSRSAPAATSPRPPRWPRSTAPTSDPPTTTAPRTDVRSPDTVASATPSSSRQPQLLSSSARTCA